MALRIGRHHAGLAGELHPIARFQLAAAAGFLEAVDPHLAPLNPQLGLAAGAHQRLPFEELIQADRLGAGGFGVGQKSADSLP